MSESNVWGIYVPPVMAYIAASVALFMGLNFLIRITRLDRVVWHLALFEISIGVIIFSSLMLYF